MDHTINTRGTTNFGYPFPSRNPHQHNHLLLGHGGASFGFSRPHPSPYISSIPPPTYSSLPPPQFTHQYNSNPPLLPLPVSRSTSLRTPSPLRSMPPHHREMGKARRDQKKTKMTSSRSKKEKQSSQVQVKASAQFEERRLDLVESPPPSSLPLPRFSMRPKISVGTTCNVEAMDKAGRANGGGVTAEELLRL